ncbi:unnamed protein product [Phaeothamnion confervicola]
MYPEFLQRTLPYLFTYDETKGCYRWADVAFVQVPQRFEDVKDWKDPDPLGNQAMLQFDVVNCGRDGVGSAMSCGQGSIWRVQALRNGIRPDGSKYASGPEAALIGRQGGLGFRSEVLIEDTHTSIDLFKQGWKSVYVNFPGEILAQCTHAPDTVKWRVKQVLRWHQGAAQLLLWKGPKYAVSGDAWANNWQRIFALDALTYFLQAFSGQVLLVFPVIYGFTGNSPFNSLALSFALVFFPFIITATMPTVLAMSWRHTKFETSTAVMRDEQFWFSTSYVQLFAMMNVTYGTITRADPADAWLTTCPVWPLYGTFFLIMAAAVFNTAKWMGGTPAFDAPWVWVSCMGACVFAMHSLWPMVSFGLGITAPPAYYNRVFGLLVAMTIVALWMMNG